MKKSILAVVSLTVICALAAALLALTNALTAPIIEKRQNDAAFEALAVVLPGGEGFEKLELAGKELPASITEAYSEKSGGYVFRMVTSGYSADFVLMCGVDKDGKVAGATCIASGETLGHEKTYGANLVGQTADTIGGVDTVSGATRTTLAYREAVKDALNARTILQGGSVDLRDEAQILADNLAAALPAGEGAFTEMFLTDELDAASIVWAADNGAGYVLLVEEAYIGVDAQGLPVTGELTEAMEADMTLILDNEMQELNIAAVEGMPTGVEKASITGRGNYVLELRAAGFGINGDDWYNPSGEYIRLKVSITPEGRIIQCVTLSQQESEGIGDVCADRTFYSQFNGRDESNYKDIDAISGATYTTNGYKTAISKAFDAVKVLEALETNEAG